MQQTEAATVILVTITFFAAFASIFIAMIIANFKRKKLEIEAYKVALEKGLPVPQLKIRRSPIGTLKAGLVCIAVGAGLFILIASEHDTDGIGICAIPILIGVALIISYYIEKKSEKAEKDANG
jgi:hypothetical protein